MHHRLRRFFIGAIATLAGVTQAAAGCCPPIVPNCGCGPAVAPVAPLAVVPEMYVVNQGPVYSGPGPYITQRNWIEGDQVAPIGYPYVGYVAPPTAPRGYYYGPGMVRPRGYTRPPLRVYGRAAPVQRSQQAALARR